MSIVESLLCFLFGAFIASCIALSHTGNIADGIAWGIVGGLMAYTVACSN